MTITIHIGSLFFGIMIGFVLLATVYFFMCAKGNEFDNGWNCGRQYAEDRQKEKMEKEKMEREKLND